MYPAVDLTHLRAPHLGSLIVICISSRGIQLGSTNPDRSALLDREAKHCLHQCRRRKRLQYHLKNVSVSVGSPEFILHHKQITFFKLCTITWCTLPSRSVQFTNSGTFDLSLCTLQLLHLHHLSYTMISLSLKKRPLLSHHSLVIIKTSYENDIVNSQACTQNGPRDILKRFHKFADLVENHKLKTCPRSKELKIQVSRWVCLKYYWHKSGAINCPLWNAAIITLLISP